MRPLIVDFLGRHTSGIVAALVPTVAAVYATAIAALFLLFLRRCKQAGVSQDVAFGGALSAFVGGVIGARLFYLVVSGSLVALEPRSWVSLTGTASWGAYLGAAAGLLILVRTKRAAALPYFDVAASCVALAIALGRIGCFLNGDDFGRITDVPWAVRYPVGSYAYIAHASGGLLDVGANASLPTHPLQIYLSLAALLLFLILSAIWRVYRHSPGVTLGSFLILDGFSRFWLEFLRDPAAGGSAYSLSVSQRMCMLGIALGGTLAVVRWRRKSSRRESEATC